MRRPRRFWAWAWHVFGEGEPCFRLRTKTRVSWPFGPPALQLGWQRLALGLNQPLGPERHGALFLELAAKVGSALLPRQWQLSPTADLFGLAVCRTSS